MPPWVNVASEAYGARVRGSRAKALGERGPRMRYTLAHYDMAYTDGCNDKAAPWSAVLNIHLSRQQLRHENKSAVATPTYCRDCHVKQLESDSVQRSTLVRTYVIM